MKKLLNLLIFLFYFQAHGLLLTKQPTTIFCHGIVDNKDQMNRYAQFLENPKKTFDFVDAQIPSTWDVNSLIFSVCSWFGKRVNREKMYMGYGQDVESLSEQINPHEHYILFGFSRGGTAIINYLAEHDADNIQAIVLNAVPADIVQSIDDIQKSLGYTFAPTRNDQEKLFHTLFPAYPIGSIPSTQAVKYIKNKHLPIFIAHAKTDTLVHISSAWQLYIAFLQAGCTNVYLCELESGQHKAYPQSPDKLQFLQSLHSFYKKYHFDHNPEFAIIDDLSALQPSMHEIIQKKSLS